MTVGANGDAALSEVDYLRVRSASIRKGESRTTVTLTVINDIFIEDAQETVRITPKVDFDKIQAGQSTELVIFDDETFDNLVPRLVKVFDVFEGGQDGSVRVELNGVNPLTRGVTLTYTVALDSVGITKAATLEGPAQDLELTSTIIDVVIYPGQSSAYVTFKAVDDSLLERAEFVKLENQCRLL